MWGSRSVPRFTSRCEPTFGSDLLSFLSTRSRSSFGEVLTSSLSSAWTSRLNPMRSHESFLLKLIWLMLPIKILKRKICFKIKSWHSFQTSIYLHHPVILGPFTAESSILTTEKSATLFMENSWWGMMRITIARDRNQSLDTYGVTAHPSNMSFLN